MKTYHLASLLSPIAIALLAFGSQIALAQDASPVSRDQVRSETLQARQSGALERERITSYSPNANWGPGAPANTSLRARRAESVASRPAGAARDATSTQAPANRGRNPV